METFKFHVIFDLHNTFTLGIKADNLPQAWARFGQYMGSGGLHTGPIAVHAALAKEGDVPADTPEAA